MFFQNETNRLEQLGKSLESTIRNLEAESRQLRRRNEELQAKLMQCQEKALLFMQNDTGDVHDDDGHGGQLELHNFFTDILRITCLG